jgi:hypothetical protein
VQLGRGGGRARVDHRPHLVLRDQPGQVGRRAGRIRRTVERACSTQSARSGTR